MKGMFASTKATFTGSASQTSSSEGVKAAQSDPKVLDDLGKALYSAANDGDSSKVASLLENAGINVNFQNETGRTPLLQASYRNHPAVVQLLLKAGANVNIAEHSNLSTALHWASYSGHAMVVKLLLDAGANKDLTEKNGDWTALKWAVNQKHTEVIALLEGRAVATTTASAPSATPAPTSPLPVPPVPPKTTSPLTSTQQKELGAKLFAAAESGQVARVEELLSTPGIDINYRNDTGRTALIQAASRNEAGTAELLINAGASLDVAETTNNSTALHWSCYNGNAAITKMLLDKGANMHLFEKTNWTALQWASNQGHVAVVVLLLQAGVNVEGHPAGSRSALAMAKDDATRAAFAAHTKMNTSTTTNPSASPSTSNPTPAIKSEADKQAVGQQLQMAARNSKLEVLHSLLDAPGADINFQDTNGSTALHWAAYLGNHEAVAVLIKYKANLNLAEKSGATALTWASNKGHKEVLTLLLQAGADTEIKENGRTARQQAKDATIVQIFEAHAAKGTAAPAPAPAPLPTPPVAAVSKKDEVGKKLQMACRHKEMHTIKSMLSAPDADVNYQDKDNAASALHWAAYLGHADVVKLLIEYKANLDLKETTGATALHWASSEEYAEVVRLLLLAGANTTLLKHNRTARQQAKNADIENIFLGHANGTLSAAQQPAALAVAPAPVLPVTPAAVPAVVVPPVPPPVTNTVVTSEESAKQASAGCIYITDSGAAAEQSIKKSTSEPATENSTIATTFLNLNEVELGTALNSAASKGDLTRVRQLLSAPGININKYQNSETALIQACYEGHLPVAQLLVEKGANLNLRDQDGWTALHWAAYNGFIEIVRLLVGGGIDVTIESKKGKTALDSCTNQDIKDIISNAH